MTDDIEEYPDNDEPDIFNAVTENDVLQNIVQEIEEIFSETAFNIPAPGRIEYLPDSPNQEFLLVHDIEEIISENQPMHNILAESISATIAETTERVTRTIENMSESNDIFSEAVAEIIAPEPTNVQKSPVKVGPCSDPDTPSRKRKRQDDDDEGKTCPVCFDPWTAAGEHRLVSLKCGHLFGSSCVERWLRSNSKTCPLCAQRAKKNDIRPVYASKVFAVDNTDLVDAKLTIEQLRAENYSLRNEVQTYKQILAAAEAEKATRLGTIPFLKYPMLLYSHRLPDGECRVMAYNEVDKIMAISQSKSGGLWPGFGVRFLTDGEVQGSRYTGLHKKEIRNLAFHPVHKDKIVSISFDNECKIFSVLENRVVFSCNLEEPLWSSEWDTLDGSNSFLFVGTGRGRVFRFNISPEIEPSTQQLLLPLEIIKPTAVIALKTSRRLDCLLCCRLLSLCAYLPQTDGKYDFQFLLSSGSGKYSAMNFTEDDSHDPTMVLYAPPSYSFYKLHIDPANTNVINIDLLNVVNFTGQPSFLSRNSLTTIKPHGCRLFVAFEEMSSTVHGYLVEENKKIFQLKCNSLVRDIVCAAVGEKIQVFLLSPNNLKCYQIN